MTVNFSFKNFFPILNLGLALTGTALFLQSANASETSCITAGRFNADGKWSPQFNHEVFLKKLSEKVKQS